MAKSPAIFVNHKDQDWYQYGLELEKERDALKSALKEAVDALEKSKDLINEIVAYGNCECDIPKGVTCVPCECSIQNKANEQVIARCKPLLEEQ